MSFNRIKQFILILTVISILQASNPALAFNFKFPFFKKNKPKQEKTIEEKLPSDGLDEEITPVLDENVENVDEGEVPAV